jgi:hypothetical protein
LCCFGQAICHWNSVDLLRLSQTSPFLPSRNH